MYLLTNEQQVNLEVLDNRQLPLCTVPATLLSMHGEWATALVPAEANPSGLRWGAWVRFWIGEGPESFEVIGAVTAVELQRESLERTSSPTQKTRPREVLLRLHEFRSVSQRRIAPRQFRQTKIWFRSVSKEEYQLDDLNNYGMKGDRSASEWNSGMCIDVSPGGMRIRAEADAQENENLFLSLTFPTRKFDAEAQKFQFQLPCRVIRRTPCIRNASAVEIAVKFDSLSVDDGIALSNWITR